MTALERADIIEGLRELVIQLQREGEVAGVRLVGGAALALRYFDRGVTRDLDALHVHPGSDEAVAAAALASRHPHERRRMRNYGPIYAMAGAVALGCAFVLFLVTLF